MDNNMKFTCFECDRTFWIDMTARIDEPLYCPYCRKMVVRIPAKEEKGQNVY